MQWEVLATDKAIDKTIGALNANGFDALVVETGEDAKKKVLEIIPKHAEVMPMTSVTLDTIGVSQAINDSGDYDSVRNKLNTMNREKQSSEMQKIGAAPEWAIGSVHAITEDGKVLIASNTGSQLPAYVYGSSHVIWIVGTQKIVSNVADATTRIYDYVLPLETKRARKAYNLPDTFHSNVSKLLIINKELVPHRITLIFVKEKFGY
ncbi:MAG TPA: LUD domain-containing protein [Candidatus Sulfotelmatobacter sp.]|jgi:L-lactate utilization protein LutB|nr:LUD domain-containing protein [Candidatus Sulfotelmatobacter sp.]